MKSAGGSKKSHPPDCHHGKIVLRVEEWWGCSYRNCTEPEPDAERAEARAGATRVVMVAGEVMIDGIENRSGGQRLNSRSYDLRQRKYKMLITGEAIMDDIGNRGEG
ncbi:uncharacterized protein EAF01_009436 [Botrytis porri]|uniref:Uncharacterized protein n=1 Tax=Botrytis porri TaxID=87229 RepID=A0A4Z1K4D8_9HELO|nr:uncharacterized protein EAF01_009436 [Botrytis porri]KAF7895474.1 hypothetical protein EAF01_009436 [Botrytis porri]TGO80981.1 hypothetical protein BPOR_1460g00010 [Botrytis porri]